MKCNSGINIGVVLSEKLLKPGTKAGTHVSRFRQSRWQPRRPRPDLDSHRVGHLQLNMALLVCREERTFGSRRIHGKDMITISVMFEAWPIEKRYNKAEVERRKRDYRLNRTAATETSNALTDCPTA